MIMNRNFAAYAANYLVREAKMDKEFVMRLVRASVDASLCNTIDDCKWEDKGWVLTTPEDEENDKLKAIEDAAWYNDEFGDHMVDTSKKEKLKYASKEALDELNCDHSYKSVHQKKGNYVGSPDAPSFQLGGKSRKGADEVMEEGDSEEEEGVELAKMSHADLVKLLKKHNITSNSKGSPPKDDEGSGFGRNAEGDSSSGSYETDSGASTDGSDVEVVENPDETSPPSGGGSTVAPGSGRGE
jgi:hypothetical protein